MSRRFTPFDLVFGPIADERFPAIQASLRASQADPEDPDAFMLDREVVGLLREQAPSDVGEAIGQHLALLHHVYLFWTEGARCFRMSRPRLEALIAQTTVPEVPLSAAAPRAYYIQFPERVVWAALAGESPPEPLDGMFVRPWPNGGVFVLAVFGLYAERAGFTVVDAEGYRPDSTGRDDGDLAFSPTLPGGKEAGLYEIRGEDELVELAVRTVPVVALATGAAEGAKAHTEVIEIS